MVEKAVATTLISLWVVNSGVLFEQKKWVYYAEWIRIAVYSLLIVMGATLLHLPAYFYFLGAGYGLLSGFWFFKISTLKHEKISVG